MDRTAAFAYPDFMTPDESYCAEAPKPSSQPSFNMEIVHRKHLKLQPKASLCFYTGPEPDHSSDTCTVLVSKTNQISASRDVVWLANKNSHPTRLIQKFKEGLKPTAEREMMDKLSTKIVIWATTLMIQMILIQIPIQMKTMQLTMTLVMTHAGMSMTAVYARYHGVSEDGRSVDSDVVDSTSTQDVGCEFENENDKIGEGEAPSAGQGTTISRRIPENGRPLQVFMEGRTMNAINRDARKRR